MPKVSQDPIEGERWLPIAGYQGVYEVSDHGRVRSLDRIIDGGKWGWERRNGRIMKLNLDQKGYPQVGLRKNGHHTTRKVHHLVLETFVGPRPDGYEGCHGDGNPVNARLDNLRWDTRSMNHHDRVRHGRSVQANRTHCPRNHELNDLNNIPSKAAVGARSCLACSRAKDDARTAIKNGATNVDKYATADAHYEAIMAGRPSPGKCKPLSTDPKEVARREWRRQRKAQGLPRA